MNFTAPARPLRVCRAKDASSSGSHPPSLTLTLSQRERGGKTYPRELKEGGRVRIRKQHATELTTVLLWELG
jgi:hypothetical protein